LEIKFINFTLLQKSLVANWHKTKSFLKFRQEYTLPEKVSDELIGDLLERIPYRKVSNIKSVFPEVLFKNQIV
jgi:hypothetical protein